MSRPMIHFWFIDPDFGINDQVCFLGDWPRWRRWITKKRIIRVELVGLLV